jgi:hypothetical protein
MVTDPSTAHISAPVDAPPLTARGANDFMAIDKDQRGSS